MKRASYAVFMTNSPNITAALQAINQIAERTGHLGICHLVTAATNGDECALGRLEALCSCLNLEGYGTALEDFGTAVKRNGTYSRSQLRALSSAMDGFDCARPDGAIDRKINSV